MIARVWHGRTSVEKSEDYKTFLTDVAVKDYKSISGLTGLKFLHRIENHEAHFMLISFWPSMEVIKKFAGEDVDRAKYYEEDKNFLLEFEERVKHYEVFYHDDKVRDV